jgi:protein-S-isoprenylcysteine O-methyltransferase Ste14
LPRVPNETAHLKIIWQSAALWLTTGAILFGTAGTLRWWNGWVMLGCTALAGTLVGILSRQSPDLFEERKHAGERAKPWDRAWVSLATAVLPVLGLILAGLDRRFGWTHSVTSWESLFAGVVMVGASALTYWAMRSNRFFSTHVRIQSDRGHTVVTHRPYRVVRHPGYTGAIGYNLAAPILLGSLVAFSIGVAVALLLVLRMSLEDRTLRRELAGYREYASRVRYRLVPRVW